MKQSKFIRKCGPYEVCSISQDSFGVRLEVYPAFPEENLTPKEQQGKDISPDWAKEPRWAIHRYNQEGGGPSIFTVIGLAREFEAFLNQCYTVEQVAEWKKTNAEALKKVRTRADKRFERAMKKLEAEA